MTQTNSTQINCITIHIEPKISSNLDWVIPIQYSIFDNKKNKRRYNQVWKPKISFFITTGWNKFPNQHIVMWKLHTSMFKYFSLETFVTDSHIWIRILSKIQANLSHTKITFLIRHSFLRGQNSYFLLCMQWIVCKL